MPAALKDQLFNADKVADLALRLAAAQPGLSAAGFAQQVMARLPALELKARIAWIAECLGQTLPGPLPQIAPVLLALLPPPLDPTLRDGDFGDFIHAPLGELVAARATAADLDLALDLLAELTQRFSMEWAIRPLLNRWPEAVQARLVQWVDHPSYHVRRLVSEGTRPRLPWGMGLVGLAPGFALPLLDRLQDDPTRFVTRSVANHLNDIARHDPAAVLDRLAAWDLQASQASDERRWIRSHALRGLIKAGHAGAMAALGYDPDADLTARLVLDPGPVRIGATLGFAAHLQGTVRTPVLVDYQLVFHRPDGRRGQKVFKLKQAVLTPGKTLVMSKSHRMKGDATTFRLYPGPHLLRLQVNGRICAEAGFDLIAS